MQAFLENKAVTAAGTPRASSERSPSGASPKVRRSWSTAHGWCLAPFGPDGAWHLLAPAAPQRMVGAALKAFARIGPLGNHAAWGVRSNLVTASFALFDRAVAGNVRAPLLWIQAALPHLKKSGSVIANIGSRKRCKAAS